MIRNMVSVIIPTYKGSGTVLRAVESVLQQTYTNYEIIVVDDNGSGSPEQIKTQHVLSDLITAEKIHYIAHKENRNGSSARNTGILASSGDYISFLDDDDIWFPEKIEKQVECFDSLDDSYGLIFCGGYNVDINGFGGRKISKFPKGNILYDLLVHNIDFNSSMLMIRRSVLNDVPSFDESYQRLQDWEFSTRILYKYNGYGMKEYLVVKFRAERNMTNSPEQLLEIYEHHMKKINYILESLGKQKCSNVKARFYRRIALEYFRYGNIKKGIEYLGKNEPLIKGALLLSKYVITHGFYRILYKKKKVIW